MSEKFEVKISIRAKKDLQSIALYIKNTLKEPNIAKKYAKLLKAEIENLEYFPQRNSIIDDEIIRDLNIRKLIIKNYIVFYRINEDKKIVNVERVIYGSSDWINKL